MSTIAAHVPGESDAGAKVTIVIMRQCSCCRVTDCFQSEIGSTQRLGLGSNQVKVFIPTHAEIQRQVASEFPVILEIDPEHLGAAGQIKIGIACGRRHSRDRPGRRKALGIARLILRWATLLGIAKNHAGKICKINLEGWVELEEAAQLPLPNIVKTSPEGVITSGD